MSFITLGAADLLVGEQVVAGKNVSAIVNQLEYGLSTYGPLAPPRLPGMRPLERIGGRLHLTNYRLVFTAHPVNRLKGRFSILLPTVVEAADTSVLLSRKLGIHTSTRAYSFQIWGIPEFLAAIEHARAGLQPTQMRQLFSAAIAEPAKVVGDLQVRRTVEAFNRGAVVLADVVIEMAAALAGVRSEIDAVAVANFTEFLWAADHSEDWRM